MQQLHLGASGASKEAFERQRPPGWTSRWKSNAGRLQREFIVVWLILRRPGTPWYARMVAGGVAAYVLSPVQIIPSFIPVIGFMDDALVLYAGLALIRMLTPKDVLQDARDRAQAAMKRRESIRPFAVRSTTMVVAGLWLVLTIGLFLVLRG